MEKTIEFLQTSGFSECVQIRLPVIRITGAEPGPTILLMAGQHGRELNGTAILHLLAQELEPEKIHGTVVMIPSMNPMALQMRQQDFPSEAGRYNTALNKYQFHNMNRKWGGDEDRTAAGKIVEAVIERYGKTADVIVDLHGWYSPTAAFSWQEDKDYLQAFGIRRNIIINPDRKEPAINEKATDKFHAMGKKVFLIEFFGQTSVFPESVREGLTAMRNLLIHCKVMNGTSVLPPMQFIEKNPLLVYAPVRGLVIPLFADGEFVPSGAEYLQIVSIETGEKIWSFVSPRDMINIYSARYSTGEGFDLTSVAEPGMLIGHLTDYEKLEKRE